MVVLGTGMGNSTPVFSLPISSHGTPKVHPDRCMGHAKCLQSQPRSEWQWLATVVVLSSSELSTVLFHSLLQRDRWSPFPHLSDVGFSYRLTLDNRVRTEEEKQWTVDSMTWLYPSLCHSLWSNTSLEHLSGSKREVTHTQSKPNSPSHSWS